MSAREQAARSHSPPGARAPSADDAARRTPRARGRAAPRGRRAASATRRRASQPTPRRTPSRARRAPSATGATTSACGRVHRPPPALQHGEAEVDRLPRRCAGASVRARDASAGCTRASGEGEVDASSTQPARPTAIFAPNGIAVMRRPERLDEGRDTNSIAAPYIMRTAGFAAATSAALRRDRPGAIDREAQAQARRAREHDRDAARATNGPRRTTRRCARSRSA